MALWSKESCCIHQPPALTTTFRRTSSGSPLPIYLDRCGVATGVSPRGISWIYIPLTVVTPFLPLTCVP